MKHNITKRCTCIITRKVTNISSSVKISSNYLMSTVYHYWDTFWQFVVRLRMPKTAYIHLYFTVFVSIKTDLTK